MKLIQLFSNKLHRSRMFVILATMIAPFLLVSCKGGRKFKREYYAGTKIVSVEGYYANDHPVDTIKKYLKNGSLESKEVYNSEGRLNGKCISYYENGVPSETMYYLDGIQIGQYVSYRENGTKKLVGYLFNGNPVGDVYYFDSLNRLASYNFLDFHNQALMARQFDSVGNITDERNNFYLFDSIKVSKGKNDTDTLDILLLICHLPKTSMKINIKNIRRDGKVVNTVDIPGEDQFVHYSDVINREVDTIRETGVYYDSAKMRSKSFVILRLAKDLR